MEDSEWIVLGAAEYGEAKRLKAALEERGVAIKLVSDPGSCGTGSCKPKLELMAKASDLDRIKQFMTEERVRDLGDLSHDESLAGEVFDPERETARCPACGTEFSTKLAECPDCGLCFAGA